MTVCELCYRQVSRRKKREGVLVCDWCWAELCASKPQLIKEKIRLRGELDALRANPFLACKKQYAYNHPVSAVPAQDILEKAILALDLTKYYSDFSTVLGDYYGFSGPAYLRDKDQVSKGAIACYRRDKNTVYSAEPNGTSHDTAFHEFWHALEAHGIVPRTGDSEKNANLYAKACLKRLKEVA